MSTDSSVLQVQPGGNDTINVNFKTYKSKLSKIALEQWV
jgi:hypothetical protein